MPILKDLLQLKEAFYAIYDAREKQEAYERYIAWQASIPPTLYEAFLPLLFTLEEWGGGLRVLRNTPDLTNAFIERANLFIREATRITFGLSYRTLRAKLLFCPSNVAARRSSPQRFQPQEVTAP